MFAKILRIVLPTCVGILVIIIGYRSFDLHSYQTHFTKIVPVTGVQTFADDGDLKMSPTNDTWMVKLIDSTHEKAFVSVYTFTLPIFREALLRAKNRGVDVRVLLEKSPYESTYINRDTLIFFRDNGIPVHESSADQFAFMHAKYMIFDTTWVIETANWTRSSFLKNREFFYISQDPAIRENLIKLFEKDFDGEKGVSQDIRVLAGPTNARERLEEFIRSAQKKIDIYAASLTDEGIVKTLENTCRKGIKVRILLASYDDEVGASYDSCLQVHYFSGLNLHAKVIIRDDREAFLGSFNYTKNSLENNREVGIFLQGKEVTSLANYFAKDW